MPKQKPPARRQNSPQEDIDPVWIAKALAATVLVAVLCGYLTLCGYFYQGQWQLVLHPSPAVSATPASLNLAFEDLHFSVDESGTPQLNAWYISGTATQPTILYLHSGDGSLADTLPQIQSLHALGFNLFAIDYRGFGHSAPVHPNQQRMNEDAEHALQYLLSVRKVAAMQIIPYGTGVGASLAAALVANHPDLPALILESPQTDLLPTVAQNPRTRLIPLHLLFHDVFPLAGRLSALRTPKLLLTNGPATPPVFANASDPKINVDFAHPSATDYANAITGFRDQYLPHPAVPLLMPSTK